MSPRFDYQAIRDAYALRPERFKRARLQATADRMRCGVPTVIRAIKHADSRGDGASATQGPSHAGQPRTLARNHAAVVQGRTMFPSRVRDPMAETSPILKPGANHNKLGAVVRKGAWSGMPIFTLSLEERASCPATCALWASCYGNGTPYALRMRHGPELEARLAIEVRELAARHPAGFVVRLHTLGDFYSVAYVNVWRAFVASYDALHVFGYTAHVDYDTDDIAVAIGDAVAQHWPRFAIRRSAGWSKARSTVVIEHERGAPADAIVCPAQTGKTTSCATCALCWSTDRRIAFLRH